MSSIQAIIDFITRVVNGILRMPKGLDDFCYESDHENASEINSVMEIEKPRLISIEGNIGAGKSTLVEELKERYKDRGDIVFLQEPVDIWESIQQEGMSMLELFYNDQKKYSFAFQVLAFTTRLRLIRHEIEMAKTTGVKTIVMERSLDADRQIFAKMLYEDGMMEQCMYDIYQRMSDDALKEYSSDGIIWLTTDPEECKRRIETRGRDGEDDISLRYLEKCDVCHREWLGADLGFAFIVEDMVEWDKMDAFLG